MSDLRDSLQRGLFDQPAKTETIDLEGLNDPQREAVLHGDGPLVVFAGAGSGKTRVITHRIAHLIAERGVSPYRILAVTFTNKAAAEMRERLEVLVGHKVSTRGGIKSLQVGTFHSTCARLLRKHANDLGLDRGFSIYDDQDQRAMIKRVMTELNVNPKRIAAKAIQGAINHAKQEMVGPDDYVTEGDPFHEVIRRLYGTYEKHMRRANALDFGDLIYRMALGLEENTKLREELAGRFLHVLVDEFQDTNHAQLRLVRAFASGHGNLVVVGDDDQSIYGWRGADRRNILDFKQAYPQAVVIKLEQNYRSSQRILRVAHAVIARNVDREPKEMWTDNELGEPVFVVRTEDERDEARMVVRGIEELSGKGDSLDEVAVFYRTHAQSRVLEEALRQRNVPYRVVGGVRFYDRAEVKDLLAYLRVLVNPEDDVSVLRILNVPARGIGKTTAERLLNHASLHGTGVWQAIEQADDHARLNAGAKKKLRGFRELIERLRAKVPELVLNELAGEILEATGIVAKLKLDNNPESDARIQNLEELVGSMEEFLRDRAGEQEGDPSVSDYLEEVTLATSADEDDAREKVTLMTVHAAKGLEFDTVMVTGLEEGTFPMRGTEYGQDPDELEEERRLAYVAFTRARKQLILSYAQIRRLYGQVRPGNPSRFLEEMPREDVEWIGIAPRGTAPTRGRSGAGYGGRAPIASDPWDDVVAPTSPVVESGESYVDYGEVGAGVVRGMRVRHKKFGIGKVLSVDTMGMTPKVEVIFQSGEKKRLALRFLQPA